MTKSIEDYTVNELSEKIKEIKAERERTANTLKRYEEELERREVGLPLGVPVEDNEPAHCHATYMFNFNSTESQCMFSERLRGYVKALVANSKGEPIDIKVLKPLLRKGWVAMDENGDWYWYEEKPRISSSIWVSSFLYMYMSGFNIKPADNWEDSLQECGL